MKSDKPYLQHISDAISDIEKFTDNTSKDLFFANKEKQYAIIRALEIIGEAAKNISPELKSKHPHIPWKTVAGMRDKLIHAYFGVNLERVWHAVQQDIPQLKDKISALLKETEAE